MVVGGEVGYVFVMGGLEIEKGGKGGDEAWEIRGVGRGERRKGLGISEGPTGRLAKGYKTTNISVRLGTSGLKDGQKIYPNIKMTHDLCFLAGEVGDPPPPPPPARWNR